MGGFSDTTFELVSPGGLGAVMLGLNIGLILFGVALLQTYIYYSERPDDSRYLKVLVAGAMVLETIHSVTGIHAVYIITIPSDPSQTPTLASNSLCLNTLVEHMLTVVVQWYFIYRIYRLSGSLILGCACWFVSGLRMVSGIFLAVKTFEDVPRRDGFHVPTTFGWLITSAFVVSTTVDVTIAALICYYLWKISAPSKNRLTLNLVHRIMIGSMSTGLATSITSVISLACFQGMGTQNYIWLGVYMVLAKVYTNSLLVTLNARPLRPAIVRDTCESLGLHFVSGKTHTNQSSSQDVPLAVHLIASRGDVCA